MTDYEGLVALVTGGASGIGAATVRLLAARGAQVAVLDRDAVAPDAAALSLECDVTDAEAVAASVDAVARALRPARRRRQQRRGGRARGRRRQRRRRVAAGV